MYKKLLYNDNCILHEESNTVIFDFNEEWGGYIEWKINNPIQEHKIFSDREGLLKWNQGVESKEDNKETKYHKNGKLFYEKVFKNDKLKSYREYFFSGNIHKETLYRNSVRLELEYNDGYQLIYSKKYFVNNECTKKISYYKTSSAIFTIKTKISESEFLYKEYYETGILRSIGTLDINNKMIGEWSFYSRDGVIESTHYFIDGELHNESVMYTQLGDIKNIVKHD